MNSDIVNPSSLMSTSHSLKYSSPTTFYVANAMWKSLENTKDFQLKVQEHTKPMQVPQMFMNINNAKLPEPDWTPNMDTEELMAKIPSSFLEESQTTSLVERSATLEEVNQVELEKEGNTPLHWAVSEGSEVLVQLLVEQGAQINAQNFMGQTPLFIAAANGLSRICFYLLENGANPNITSMEGTTAAHIAAASGHLESLITLAKYGAFLNSQDEEGDSVLHYAIRENQYSIVEFLVRDCKVEIDLKNEDMEDPLELASCLGQQDLVNMLNYYCSQQN